MFTSPAIADEKKGRLHSPYGTTQIIINQNPTENAPTVVVGIPGDSVDILERANGWVKVSLWFNGVANIGWVQEEYIEITPSSTQSNESSNHSFPAPDGSRENPLILNSMTIEEIGALLHHIGVPMDKIMDAVKPAETSLSPFQIKRDKAAIRESFYGQGSSQAWVSPPVFIAIRTLNMIPNKYNFSDSEYEICYGGAVTGINPLLYPAYTFRGGKGYAPHLIFINAPDPNSGRNCTYQNQSFRDAVSHSKDRSIGTSGNLGALHFPMNTSDAETLFNVSRVGEQYRLMETSIVCELKVSNIVLTECNLISLSGIIFDENFVSKEFNWKIGGDLQYDSHQGETAD